MDESDLIDCRYNNYLSAKEFEQEELRRNLEKYGTFGTKHETNKQIPLTFINVTDHNESF
jgi:hypothetical protein